MALTKRSAVATRRGFLAAGLIAANGNGIITADTPPAQALSSPAAALNALLEGNKRYTSQRTTACEEDFSILRQNTADKQEPFAAILSCADSRVPAEIIFDQSIGHVFVARVAGNIATPEMIASLEYAVAVLGTKAILVLGHANCGAVKAAMQGKDAPGQISALYARIHPAVDQAGPNLEAAIKANAKIQQTLLCKASTVISKAAEENKVKVAAAYYDLVSGRVTLLDQ